MPTTAIISSHRSNPLCNLYTAGFPSIQEQIESYLDLSERLAFFNALIFVATEWVDVIPTLKFHVLPKIASLSHTFLNALPPDERVLSDALVTTAFSRSRRTLSSLGMLKFHLLLQRVPQKYHSLLISGHPHLQAFAKVQLEKQWKSSQIDQLVKHDKHYRLLYLCGHGSTWVLFRNYLEQIPQLKKTLLDWIERSKTDDTVQKNAARAITLLVRAGVKFNHADLNNIQIPGADLSGGEFWRVQFKDSNLKKVIFTDAKLGQTSLDRAKMEGVQFGEGPFLQQPDMVLSGTYSPDGSLYVVGLGNGQIHVYNTSNWENIKILEAHAGEVRYLLFSPKGDFMVSCGLNAVEDGSEQWSVKEWFVAEWGYVHNLPYAGFIHSIAYLPTGQQIVLTGEYQCLWEVHAATAPMIIQNGVETAIARYSPTGDQIALKNGDEIHLVDVQARVMVHVLRGHRGEIEEIIYSPTSQHIASYSVDQTVRLWDLDTGKLIHTLRHDSMIVQIAYSPKGDLLASYREDHKLQLWDVKTGQCLHTLEGDADSKMIAFSSSGALLASEGSGHTVYVWLVKTGKLLRILRGHTSGVTSISFSFNENQIVSCSFDETVRVWSVDIEQPALLLEVQKSRFALKIAYSPIKDQITLCNADNTAQVRSGKTGQLLHTFSPFHKEIGSVSYSPDGEMIAFGLIDRTPDFKTGNVVELWSTETWEHVDDLYGDLKRCLSIAYSPDGSVIAAAGDEKIKLWMPFTNLKHEIRQRIHSLDENVSLVSVKALAYLPDNKRIVFGSSDHTVRLSHIEGLQHTRVLGHHDSPIVSVTHSPDGKWVAAGGESGSVLLCSLDSFRILRFGGHNGAVKSLAYLLNGRIIVSGGEDCSIILWDVHTLQSLVEIPHCAPVISVNGIQVGNEHYLLVVSADHCVYKYQLIVGSDHCQLNLCWTSVRAGLTLSGISTEGVKDLSPVNGKLLEQRRTESKVPIFA